jgi:sulfatase maturation enzyme AslB (radical SAM superfamily)
MSIDYDAEADWTLLKTCTFRCSYCFVPLSARKARISRYATLARMQEPATINILGDDRWLNGVPNYHGALCGAGHRFVWLEPDGTVFRCGPGRCLGNLLDQSVRFASNARNCDTAYCPYFCEKYTGAAYRGTAGAAGAAA